jgi:hypothetical protein
MPHAAMPIFGARCALNKTEGPLSWSQGPHYGTLGGTVTPLLGVEPINGVSAPKIAFEVTGTTVGQLTSDGVAKGSTVVDEYRWLCSEPVNCAQVQKSL